MNWETKKNKKLIQAVLSLKTDNEARRFLRDLMTKKEINEFANRLEAAGMLIENTPYSSIEKETGLSSTTVARVAKWLKGKEGGYRTILERLHHNNFIRSRRGLS